MATPEESLALELSQPNPSGRAWRPLGIILWFLSRISKGWPLWLYLALFGIMIIVPAVLGSSYFLYRYDEAERQGERAAFLQKVQQLAGSLDRELSNSLTTLRILAASPDLDRRDFAAFHASSAAALKDTGYFVLLLDPTYRQLVNTRVPYGSELGQSSDPKTPQATFEDGRPQVSDVFAGKVARQPVFNVTMPVKRGEAIPYVLVLARNAGSLLASISAPTLLASSVITVVGSDDRIIARSSDHQHFVTQALSPAIAGKTRGAGDVITIDDVAGAMLLVAEEPLHEAAWRVILTEPLAENEARLVASLGRLIVSGIALLALSLASAILLGRYIALPMRGLARQARALGERQVIRPVASHLEEANEVSMVLAEAADEREQHERHIGLLIDELRHRSKNQFAVIQALTDLTAKRSHDLDDFQRCFLPRVRSLSDSLGLLDADQWQTTDIATLVQTQLRSFGTIGKRIEITGPAVRTDSEAAQSLGLALHELGTNATKYGALSVKEGHVMISWAEEQVEDQDEVIFWMRWQESGGPPVRSPSRTGFGTTIMDRMLSHSTDGSVTLDFQPAGLMWRFECPKENLTKTRGSE